MRCVAAIAAPGGWNTYRCSNKAKYGKYCGVHCPEKQAERAAQRGPTQWERECAERKRSADNLDALLAAARWAERFINDPPGQPDDGDQFAAIGEDLRKALEPYGKGSG